MYLRKECCKKGSAQLDKAIRHTTVIKRGTYNAATLPANIVECGVVLGRRGNLIYAAAKDASDKQWAEPYQVKLTGFDFATGGSFTLTINSTVTGAITYLTGSGENLTTTAVKIMAALEAAGFTAAIGWSCTAGVDHILVKQSWYTPNVTTFTVTDADAKVTRMILTGNYQTSLAATVTPGIGITPFGDIARVDGSASYYAGANIGKFQLYYSTNGTTGVNQPLGTVDIIKEANFTAELNPVLVAYYKTYQNYILSKMLRFPWSKKAILNNNGKLNTAKLAAITYTKSDGATGYAYPAAAYAKQYGIATAGYTTGFEAGNWFCPSIEELYMLIKNVTMGLPGITTANCDLFNQSMSKIGGTLVQVTNYIWTSSELSSSYAWFLRQRCYNHEFLQCSAVHRFLIICKLKIVCRPRAGALLNKTT